MSSRDRHLFLFLCLLQFLRGSSSRNWMDVVDPKILQNDGMPRVAPPRNKTEDQDIISHSTNAQHTVIEIHGTYTTLFEEVDPFRVTDTPTTYPSYNPTFTPSSSRSVNPTSKPSVSLSSQPIMPTVAPTFSVVTIPGNPKAGYFNYDPLSSYGPNGWKNIQMIDKEDPGFFWHTFDLDDAEVSNECGSNKKQSPIDLCKAPRDTCTETHEMRPLPGDYKMDSTWIAKQILPNKLRLVMSPRTGDEPDPPQIDFSSTGQGLIDMTNIDFKFPSEHTVCGRSFDGEMQYYAYNPGKKRFVAVSFLLDASDSNPKNEHLQEVIDAFILVYNVDKRKCEEKQSLLSSTNSSDSGLEGGMTSLASSFLAARTNSSAASIAGGDGIRKLHGNVGNNHGNNAPTSLTEEEEKYDSPPMSVTMHGKDPTVSGSRLRRRRLSKKWHPFDPDVQKTIHFWGYSGSITEPPCTALVDWKIMDVPTPISKLQLAQFKHILFSHVDANCQQTSVHNTKGSVARPTQVQRDYYKCTRDEYVSDEEAVICGLEGCKNPFGAGLNQYYPPLVDVTSP